MNVVFVLRSAPPAEQKRSLSVWVLSGFVCFQCHFITPRLRIKSDLSTALEWGKVITYFAFFGVLRHCTWQVDKCIWKTVLHVRLGRQQYLRVGQDPLEDLPGLPQQEHVFQAGYLTPTGPHENSVIAENLCLWTVQGDIRSPLQAAAARPWPSTERLLWFVMIQRAGKLQRNIAGFIQLLEMDLNALLCNPWTGSGTVCCIKKTSLRRGLIPTCSISIRASWGITITSHKRLCSSTLTET